MNLAICSLASGSSGNCYLIKSNKAAILADAGISGRQISLRLGALGLGIENINAVVVTHEHSDHTKGLSVLAKSEGVKFFLSEGTEREIAELKAAERIRTFSPGECFEIEDIRVDTFHLSHDAVNPVGYSFESGGKKISVVTDTGVVTEEIFGKVKDSDILVLESNHDVNMLKIGPYPWFLKQRILSDHGHLSNDSAAEVLMRIAAEEKGAIKQRQILLAHLSRENNFPEMALATVNNILEAEGLIPGKEFLVSTLSREEAGPVCFV